MAYRTLYPLARSVLFSLDPERSHDLSLWCLRNFGGWLRPVSAQPAEQIVVMGITFPNRVGLAAGLDKDAEAIDALSAFGFGHIEVGTVTPRPQPGNAKPRMFRLIKHRAIINRMGFNNHGVDNLIAHVKSSRYKGVLGINIGKNADTPIEAAADDYLTCLDKVYPYASYVAANISSPNTKNLRELQGESALDALLSRLRRRQAELADIHGKYVPLALKIAPDLEEDQIAVICDALRRHRIDGVIASNTTVSRETIEDDVNAHEGGGLSGAPLTEKSTELVRILASKLQGEVPIIAVGGIMEGRHAAQKLEAGASLVQLYTGFIYEGPKLVTDCISATQGWPSR